MKSVIVNVQIQLDVFTDSNDIEDIAREVGEQLNLCNTIVQMSQLDSQPQILANSINDSDMEVAPEEDK